MFCVVYANSIRKNGFAGSSRSITSVQKRNDNAKKLSYQVTSHDIIRDIKWKVIMDIFTVYGSESPSVAALDLSLKTKLRRTENCENFRVLKMHTKR